MEEMRSRSFYPVFVFTVKYSLKGAVGAENETLDSFSLHSYHPQADKTLGENTQV